MLYVLSNLQHLQTREILLLLGVTIPTGNAKPHLRLALGSKASAQRVHGLDCDRGRAGSQAPAHQVHQGVAGVEGGDVVHQFRQALERHELAETNAHGSGSRSLGLAQISRLFSHFTKSPTPRLLPPSLSFKSPPQLASVKFTKQPGECWGYSGVRHFC